MGDKEKLTFVAIGDSLTAGFTPFNTSRPWGHGLPYTSYLDNIVVAELSKKGLENIECSFVNLGVNGDTTGGMLCRFDSDVASTNPDYVFVWGGINDLFGGRDPANVMESLRQIYAKAHELRSEPIACTVTSMTCPSPIVSRIRELNGLIGEHCAENHIRLADLFKAVSDESGLLRDELSSDGVHLNAKGNRRIAAAIYSDVVEQILEGLIR
jgi:lysophospholipase L1-like esterase